MKYLLKGIGKGTYGGAGTQITVSNLWKTYKTPFPLSDLSPDGASTGQTILWSGSKWVPSAPATIKGTITSNQVAFGSALDTISGSTTFLWNDTSKRLTIGSSSTSPFGDAKLFMGTDQNAETNFQISNSTNGTASSVGFRIFAQGGKSSGVFEFSPLHSSTELASKLCIDVNDGGLVPHGLAFILRSAEATSHVNFYTGGILSTNKKITLFNNGNLLIQSGGTHTDAGFKFEVSGNSRLRGNLTIEDFNIILSATTGTKIGTATNQKLAFWNKTPIIQPTTGITGASRVGGGGATITDTDTFGGYTVAQLAAILINTGLTA